MQLKTVLLSALLSSLPASLASPINEARVPGELHKYTKHGNGKGNNGKGKGNGGDGSEFIDEDLADQAPYWSVKSLSRHWNDTTNSVELSFAIWDSRDDKEVPCNINAPIPAGVNYRFAEFHSLPCAKDDIGAEKWLISMGYVEYFDAGIMHVCELVASLLSYFSRSAQNY